MIELILREYTGKDFDDILWLLQQLAAATSDGGCLEAEDLAQVLAEMVAWPGLYFNAVAERQGSVIGFVSLVFYKTTFHAGGTALINELVVDPQYRGQGIGRALIEHAKQEAGARGMEELEVGTESGNKAAQAFYRRCGFDEEHILFGMELNGNYQESPH